MDRERLTELLQDPAQVAAGDLGDLRSMTDRFPWFSGAHLLLAVGEHAQGDVLSNDPVRTPAAYLPSRAVLFDLTQAEATPVPPPMHVVKDIQRETPAFAAMPETPPAVVAAQPAIAEETRSILPHVPFAGEVPAASALEELSAPPVHAEVPPAVTEGQVPIAEEMRPILQDSAIAIAEDIASPSAPTVIPTGLDPLESQMREAIMASGYDLSRIPPPPEEPKVELAAPQLVIEAVPTLALHAVTTAPVRPATRITKESRLRFTDWLTTSDEVSPEPTVAAVPSVSEVEAPAVPVPSSIIPLASEALPDPKEIIERFIQQANPTAAPVKAEFFTPQQAAKRSLQDDGLVSETLAKIYEQQGDIAKAKAAYARLAIIHPEKSVYFAALSKALEARSNK